MIKNKFQYFGVYRNTNPNSLLYHKLIDIITYSDIHTEFWGKPLLNESVVTAVFYNCDVNGVYISPRVLGIKEEDLFLSPYAIPLKTFLENHEKL